MKYRHAVDCECGVRLAVTAIAQDHGTERRAVTVLSLKCPECRRRVGLRAPYDLDEETIEVRRFEGGQSS